MHFLLQFYVQECDGYGEWLPTLEKFEHKTAFFSNPVKSKHGKNCQWGTSFDLTIFN